MDLMIVEDNPEMRRLIRSLLCDLASAVSECDDGAEALAAYIELSGATLTIWQT
jgi:CheY-like chemotaxis protein